MADTVVKFGADITALQAGLAKSRAAVRSWGDGIGDTLKGGLAGVLGTAAVTTALSGIVKEFADVSDAADKAGVSVKFLLSIKDDAQQTGASLESAAKAVKKFILELNDPEAGEKMGGVLKALGTDVETLRQQQPEELFATLAKAIGGVDTQAEKLAILGVLLGDTGGKFESLLPLLEKVAVDGVRPVSEEMVTATKNAAALDDELDQLASDAKTTVLPVFTNFIKVLKLVGQVILAGMILPFQQLFNVMKAGSSIIEAFGNILMGTLAFDDERVKRGLDKLKSDLLGTLEKVVEDAKAHADAIGAAFDDLTLTRGNDPAAAPKAVNEALKEQIKLLGEVGAEEEKLAKAHDAELDKWQKGQEDTIKGYEAELAAIEGVTQEKKLTVSDLNAKLAELSKLQRGGGVIASSATQMGFGGRAVAEVSQNKVEQLISETNKKMDERKAEAAAVRKLMEDIKRTLE
jgi:hypothetical protein